MKWEPEPSFGVIGGELWQQFCDGLIKGLFCPCLGRAQQLLELGPGLFDGVQVRRVRRQVKQLGSCRLDSFAHSLDLVRTEIVHHHHIARPQFRTQDLIQISKEYLPIRGRLDGHSGDHAARADGAQNGEDFPSAVRGGLMNARASDTTRIQSRHLRRDAALIEKDQPVQVYFANRLDELFTPLAVLFRVPLLGVE
jgi:hypothetical protein